MRLVRSKDTLPEKALRSLLHRRGFRFRLHDRTLPGKPDLVLPKYRAVIFVHGCFWHRHPGCPRTRTPATRQDYWVPKFERTVQRDQQNQRKLRLLGWNVLTVWECELKEAAALVDKLAGLIRREAAPYPATDLPPLAAVAEEPGDYELEEKPPPPDGD